MRCVCALAKLSMWVGPVVSPCRATKALVCEAAVLWPCYIAMLIALWSDATILGAGATLTASLGLSSLVDDARTQDRGMNAWLTTWTMLERVRKALMNVEHWMAFSVIASVYSRI